MAGLVTVDVTSAFMCGGVMALPGETVDLPRGEALVLVARGKAVLRALPSAEGEGRSEDLAEDVPTLSVSDVLHDDPSEALAALEALPVEDQAEEQEVIAPAPASPRGKGKRGQGG